MQFKELPPAELLWELFGEPALLKRRCHLRREEAEKIWMNLRKQGWKQISPVWGEDVDP